MNSFSKSKELIYETTTNQHDGKILQHMTIYYNKMNGAKCEVKLKKPKWNSCL